MHRDLDAAGAVLDALCDSGPVPTVLVTGSKGKGQAAATAAACLSSAGLRTGLVASPGTVSNLDRFSLDGRVVGAVTYNSWLGRTAAAVRSVPVADNGYLSPTGLFTVMGQAMLRAAGAEVIVHEAGMGGTHDEISVLDRMAVGFTSVFPEHLDVFGPTLADVAREKFGLVRTGDQVVTVPQAPVPAEILRAVCRRHSVSPHVVRAGDFRRQNHDLGRALANIVTHRLGKEPFRGDVVIERPGRGQFCETADGREFCVDACIDPVGLASAVDRATERWGGVARVYWSVPSTKDIESVATWLDDSGIDHRFVPLESEHLDYRLPAGFADGQEFALREGLLDSIPRHSLMAGTVSFGASLLREIGAMPTRLFRPVRIDNGKPSHIRGVH